MNFNFEVNIKEKEGAINTAAKITELLSVSNVNFTVTAKDNLPCITVQFPGISKSYWIATRTLNPEKKEKTYGNWMVTRSAGENRPGYDNNYLFPHLTDAAKEVVEAWIEALVDEYQTRLDADMKDKNKITINIEPNNE